MKGFFNQKKLVRNFIARTFPNKSVKGIILACLTRILCMELLELVKKLFLILLFLFLFTYFKKSVISFFQRYYIGLSTKPVL